MSEVIRIFFIVFVVAMLITGIGVLISFIIKEIAQPDENE